MQPNPRKTDSIRRLGNVEIDALRDAVMGIPESLWDAENEAKPNRFAGRVQFTHGGKRNGAGRKPAPEPTVDRTITLYKSHLKYLRKLDSNLSRAIRKLIDAKM